MKPAIVKAIPAAKKDHRLMLSALITLIAKLTSSALDWSSIAVLIMTIKRNVVFHLKQKHKTKK